MEGTDIDAIHLRDMVVELRKKVVNIPAHLFAKSSEPAVVTLTEDAEYVISSGSITKSAFISSLDLIVVKLSYDLVEEAQKVLNTTDDNIVKRYLQEVMLQSKLKTKKNN